MIEKTNELKHAGPEARGSLKLEHIVITDLPKMAQFDRSFAAATAVSTISRE
jgi:hypothetical protein